MGSPVKPGMMVEIADRGGNDGTGAGDDDECDVVAHVPGGMYDTGGGEFVRNLINSFLFEFFGRATIGRGLPFYSRRLIFCGV